MKGRKHTPEQVVRQLREAERLLDEGQSVADAAKHLEVSEQTYLRWRNQYGGMKVEDANITSPRFFIPAAALDLGFIALLVAAIRQLVAAGRLDFGRPVFEIQTRLEALNAERIRTTLATLVVAPLAWVPLLIVRSKVCSAWKHMPAQWDMAYRQGAVRSGRDRRWALGPGAATRAASRARRVWRACWTTWPGAPWPPQPRSFGQWPDSAKSTRWGHRRRNSFASVL